MPGETATGAGPEWSCSCRRDGWRRIARASAGARAGTRHGLGHGEVTVGCRAPTLPWMKPSAPQLFIGATTVDRDRPRVRGQFAAGWKSGAVADPAIGHRRLQRADQIARTGGRCRPGTGPCPPPLRYWTPVGGRIQTNRSSPVQVQSRPATGAPARPSGAPASCLLQHAQFAVDDRVDHVRDVLAQMTNR
jgi:hypothetical protein